MRDDRPRSALAVSEEGRACIATGARSMLPGTGPQTLELAVQTPTVAQVYKFASLARRVVTKDRTGRSPSPATPAITLLLPLECTSSTPKYANYDINVYKTTLGEPRRADHPRLPPDAHHLLTTRWTSPSPAAKAKGRTSLQHVRQAQSARTRPSPSPGLVPSWLPTNDVDARSVRF